MMLDAIEISGLQVEKESFQEQLKMIHKGLETKMQPFNGYYQRIAPDTAVQAANALGISDVDAVKATYPSILDMTKQMFAGTTIDGTRTFGLKDLSQWKINDAYREQNIRQQAGYAAEIISANKENAIAKISGSGLTTVRADDLSELFQRNDPYVDKVRIDTAGEIKERIQTKFIGKDGRDWLSKMMSQKYEKYLDGHVDKLECPKDYYDGVKDAIIARKENLGHQLQRVTADGNIEVAQTIQNKLNRLDQIDQMVEKSTVSYNEAKFARLHPKVYTSKMFAESVARLGNLEGIKQSGLAAGLTVATSAVENISDFLDGSISMEELTTNIAQKSLAAGAIGYGGTFITTTISETMRASSNQLIRAVSGTCAPAAVVSFAVDSYEDISAFAQGKLDGGELAYELGESAAGIAGGIGGGALVGGAIGSFAGPVGTAAGTIVGGVVGCVAATEAYETAISLGAEGAEFLAKNAEKFANQTIDVVTERIPQHANQVKEAFRDFFSETHVQFGQ